MRDPQEAQDDCQLYVYCLLPHILQNQGKHSIVDGPQHIVTILWLMCAQPPEVVKADSPYVQTCAWLSTQKPL